MWFRSRGVVLFSLTFGSVKSFEKSISLLGYVDLSFETIDYSFSYHGELSYTYKNMGKGLLPEVKQTNNCAVFSITEYSAQKRLIPCDLMCEILDLWE